MKILVCSLVLCCCAAASATGADSAEMLRDRLLFCSQFVIEDPDPAIVRDSTRYCCRFANRAHDCHVNDWDDNHR
jgi:hypothetical protein